MKKILKTIIKKGNELSDKELILLAKETQRVFYGEGDFKKELIRLKKERNSVFFLLRDGRKLLSFGFLRPTKIKHLERNYNVFGIRNIIATEQNKGHGSLLMKEVIHFLEENEKTGLGFTGSRVAKFYKKIGFTIRRGLRKRLFLNYGKKKEEFAHWGFYLEGKDKFISNILKDKSKIDMPSKKW